MARGGSETRASVRAHFERELSFDALGLKLMAMYEDVLARKHGSSTATPQREAHRPIFRPETGL